MAGGYTGRDSRHPQNVHMYLSGGPRARRDWFHIRGPRPESGVSAGSGERPP